MSGISSDVVISAAGRWQTENEYFKLLAIFPAEIWVAILDWVDDPADMHNMAKASPFLEGFLEPQKSMYLFYMVLKIRDQGDHRAPNLCDYLGTTTSELLKCRLVCVGWKDSISRFLESRPHQFTASLGSTVSNVAYFPQAYLRDVAYRARFRLDALSDHKIQQEALLLEMIVYQDKLQNDCPSPTRHLEITDDRLYALACRSRDTCHRSNGGMRRERRRWDRLQRYRNFVKIFLEKVGHTFHHLTVQMNSYRLVGEYLELMPNLRSVYILPGKNAEQNQMQSILDISFPSLSYVNLVSLYNIPEPISKMMLDANPDAKVVQLFRYRGNNPRVEETGNSDTVWPVNPVTFSTTIASVEELLGMPITWKLNVLKLNFTEGAFIKWSSIFRKVDSYKDTLTELHLEMPPYQRDDGLPVESVREICNASKTPLNLPLLKRFEMKVKAFCSLDFLLGLKSLEHLRLTLANYVATQDGSGFYYDDMVNTEMINLNRGFSERLMECNIWELMPSLLEVDLKLGDRPMRKYRRKLSKIGCNALQNT